MASNALTECNRCAFRHALEAHTLQPSTAKDEVMPTNSLEKFVEQVRAVWGPLTTELVAECERHLAELLKTPASEAWLAELTSGASFARVRLRPICLRRTLRTNAS